MNQIRPKSYIILTLQQKLLRALFVFVLGSIIGFLAKYADSVSIIVGSGTILKIFTYCVSFIGDISTSLGIWILIATILAAWSRSPEAAAVHVFLFFAGMLILYYAYSTMLFGFFPKYYFYAWGVFTLILPIGAYILWYARGNGWVAAFCSAPPIALLLKVGGVFNYTLSIIQGFELFSAVLLFVILPMHNLQRLRVLPFVAVMFLIIWRMNLISVLFGGL